VGERSFVSRIVSSFLAATVLTVAAASMVACSKDDGPADGKFTVDFPSVAEAVSVDKIQVFVFDAQDNPDLCHQLVQGRSTGGQFPTEVNKRPVVQLATPVTFAVCDLVKSPDSVTLPAVTFGDRAVVVVGTSLNQDKLIGCQPVTTGAGDLDKPIPLSVIGDTDLTHSSCQTLRQHCDGNCS